MGLNTCIRSGALNISEPLMGFFQRYSSEGGARLNFYVSSPPAIKIKVDKFVGKIFEKVASVFAKQLQSCAIMETGFSGWSAQCKEITLFSDDQYRFSIQTSTNGFLLSVIYQKKGRCLIEFEKFGGMNPIKEDLIRDQCSCSSVGIQLIEDKPFEVVQNCLRKDGMGSLTLGSYLPDETLNYLLSQISDFKNPPLNKEKTGSESKGADESKTSQDTSKAGDQKTSGTESQDTTRVSGRSLGLLLGGVAGLGIGLSLYARNKPKKKEVNDASHQPVKPHKDLKKIS